jgi:hypothetical protein
VSTLQQRYTTASSTAVEARESSIKPDKADSPILARFVILQLIFDHPNHDLVLDQSTDIHELFRLETQWRLFCHLLSQQVAGRDVAHAELVANLGSLSSLAYLSLSEKEDTARTVR